MLINRLVVFNAIFGLMLAFGSATPADGPADNKPDAVRVIPPPGMAIDPNARQALLWRCKAIQSQWRSLLTQAKAKMIRFDLMKSLRWSPRYWFFLEQLN